MSPKYLVVALVAAVAAATASRAVREGGHRCVAKIRLCAAVAIWRPLAEGGDADAQFNLGQAYRLGRGVPLDLAAAKIWFERAAQTGPSRRADDSRSPALSERRPRRGPQMAQAGRRPRRAARTAGLRHGAIQRRRSDAGPDPRLCLCQPRRRSGAGTGPRNAGPARSADAGGRAQKAMALAVPKPKPAKVASAKAPTPTPATPQASVGQGDIDAAQGSLRTGNAGDRDWRIQLGAFCAAWLGRSALSARVGQGGAGGTQPLLYRQRRGHPAAGRPVRQQGSRRRGVRRDRSRLLPGPRAMS